MANAPDYNRKALELFASLQLGADGSSTAVSRGQGKYNDLDMVWKHPTTHACVFIGNASASRNLHLLRSHGIRRIINCTTDIPNGFEDPSVDFGRVYDRRGILHQQPPVPPRSRCCCWGRKSARVGSTPAPDSASSPLSAPIPMQYFRFHVYSCFFLEGSDDEAVLALWRPLLAFVDDALAKGENILIHCLAGAHRAGLTGVAVVAHAGSLHPNTALHLCKLARPVVALDPELMRFLDDLRRAKLRPSDKILQKQAE